MKELDMSYVQRIKCYYYDVTITKISIHVKGYMAANNNSRQNKKKNAVNKFINDLHRSAHLKCAENLVSVLVLFKRNVL